VTTDSIFAAADRAPEVFSPEGRMNFLTEQDWIIQILHGIQPLCPITHFGEGIDTIKPIFYQKAH
jgi:hypothetical protein